MGTWAGGMILFHLKESPEPQCFKGTSEEYLDVPRAVGAVRPSQPELLPVPLFPWGPAVSQWPLVSMGLHSVTLASCFHDPLQCHRALLCAAVSQ